MSVEAVKAEIDWQVRHESDPRHNSRAIAYRVLTVLRIELALNVVDDIEDQVLEILPLDTNDDDDGESFAEDPDYDPNFDRYGVRMPEAPPLTSAEEEELLALHPDDLSVSQ